MKFDFGRSEVLTKVFHSGSSAAIHRAFHSKIMHVQKEKIQFITTGYLRDMSTVVVDLGPLGEQTQEAIIAAGRKELLPTL